MSKANELERSSNKILPAGLSNAHEANKFGAIRLILAFLVIVSHSPELIDGNRSREILTQVFGTLSFGEAAVDGFFLVSGYLIFQSIERSRTYVDFIQKRILRILPGFIAAYIFSIFIIGPLVGGKLSTLFGFEGLKTILRILCLEPPRLDGAFVNMAHPHLNGSMWTISYEFRCYLLTILLAAAGILGRPKFLLGITMLVKFISITDFNPIFPPLIRTFTGTFLDSMHFFSVFLLGGSFYIFEKQLPQYTANRAFCAALTASILMVFSPVAHVGLAIFGGYALFWYSFHSKPNFLNKIGHRIDISYGLYLYAWPIQNTIIWYWPQVNPVLLLIASTLLAALLGYASWKLIEAPALKLKPSSIRLKHFS